jgi:hypothetical protein
MASAALNSERLLSARLRYVDFINCLAKFDVKAHLLIKVEKVSLAVIKIDETLFIFFFF